MNRFDEIRIKLIKLDKILIKVEKNCQFRRKKYKNGICDQKMAIKMLNLDENRIKTGNFGATLVKYDEFRRNSHKIELSHGK